MIQVFIYDIRLVSGREFTFKQNTPIDLSQDFIFFRNSSDNSTLYIRVDQIETMREVIK